MKSESTAIDMPESSSAAKGKEPLMAVSRAAKGGYRRGIAIFDFVLRLGAIVTSLAAAAAMGTSDETLPFFTQFFQFQASYDDLPTFQFFVIAMAIVAGYLVALTLNTAAGAAAAAIVYLAHNGNSNTNWLAICNQYGDFCQKVSGAVVASMITVAIFVFLIVLSAFALRRH
ncbi:hypothetical protein OIU84_010263 [Salix udensis]|uniref:CASP-like protein n=1 Tax=Salix udensis TaxID=889485 RepID=A0AAD6JKC0_9ROSI|nr:hypothetical protein OIU84_010263 [Salix udensis]